MITGGLGNDTLFGGEGQDTLRRGAGLDRFVFRHTGSAHADRVEDFDARTDDVILSGACIDHDAGLWGQGPIGTRFCKDLWQGAQDADDRVLHDRRTGNVRSDRDGAGPKLIRQLDPGTRITAADIHVDRSP